MREHPKVDARLASITSADRVVICSVVRGEIQYGIQRLPQGARRQELASKSAKLFLVVACEPVPEVAGRPLRKNQVDTPADGTLPR